MPNIDLSKLSHKELLNLINRAENRIEELKEDTNQCDITHCSSSIMYIWVDEDGDMVAERCRAHSERHDAGMHDRCLSLNEYEEEYE